MPNLNVFGVGFLEILLVLVLALIVIGPQRLPETAAQLGGMVRTLRRYANEFRREFMDEFGDLQAEWEMSQREMREVTRELSEATTAVNAQTVGVDRDISRATSEVNATLRGRTIDSTARPKPDAPSNVVAIDDPSKRRPERDATPPDSADSAGATEPAPKLQRH